MTANVRAYLMSIHKNQNVTISELKARSDGAHNLQ